MTAFAVAVLVVAVVLACGEVGAETLPIHRVWNQRPDVNHRFTMDPNVQATMMGRGHAAEGCGDPPVAMCSPL